MSEDIVEGRFHIGEKRGDVRARKCRVEEDEPCAAVAPVNPDVGVVGVAMGDDRAPLAEPFRREERKAFRE